MEFGNIGQHCTFKQCQQQDFLPFECDGCKQIYCTDHARADDHQCKLPSDFDSIYVIICPICDTRIKIKQMADPNEAWNKHSQIGPCVPKIASGSQNPVKRCMAAKCFSPLSTINKVTCPRCIKDTCMRHRFESDHQCTKVVEEVKNEKTAKSKLLMPGYFKNQNPTEPVQAQPILSTQDFTNLESAIDKFSGTQHTNQSKPKDSSTKTVPERCEVCGSLFRNVEELISHVETHFQDAGKVKVETEKCPKCVMRFSLTELVNHMQQDHFIY